MLISSHHRMLKSKREWSWNMVDVGIKANLPLLDLKFPSNTCSLFITHSALSMFSMFKSQGHGIWAIVCGFHLPGLLLVSSLTPQYFFACSRCSVTGCAPWRTLALCPPARGQEGRRNFLSCFIPRWVMGRFPAMLSWAFRIETLYLLIYLACPPTFLHSCKCLLITVDYGRC